MMRHGVSKCGKMWRVDRCWRGSTTLIGVYTTEAEANAAMEGSGGHARPVDSAPGNREPAVVLESKK